MPLAKKPRQKLKAAYRVAYAPAAVVSLSDPGCGGVYAAPREEHATPSPAPRCGESVQRPLLTMTDDRVDAEQTESDSDEGAQQTESDEGAQQTESHGDERAQQTESAQQTECDSDEGGGAGEAGGRGEPGGPCKAKLLAVFLEFADMDSASDSGDERASQADLETKKERGAARQRKYYALNKEREAARRRQYYALNKEHELARVRKYHAQHKCPHGRRKARCAACDAI